MSQGSRVPSVSSGMASLAISPKEFKRLKEWFQKDLSKKFGAAVGVLMYQPK